MLEINARKHPRTSPLQYHKKTKNLNFLVPIAKMLIETNDFQNGPQKGCNYNACTQFIFIEDHFFIPGYPDVLGSGVKKTPEFSGFGYSLSLKFQPKIFLVGSGTGKLGSILI
eukprot:TRINITY_DN20524_c3_g1_i1.p2 TRINITY_DN20524_c3_g1~~TRINITY_DN20524_c3_g1_i1.p2  ORF type:complete len:113 (+),score=1.84 TRINITY_DN20524_c3_g1_i1:247-585(+)